jgi:hypothetical protein
MRAIAAMFRSEVGSLKENSKISAEVSAALLETVFSFDSCPVATNNFDIVGMPYV